MSTYMGTTLLTPDTQGLATTSFFLAVFQLESPHTA